MNKILASCIAVAVIAAAAIGFIMLNNHSSNTSNVDDKETIAVTMSWEQGIVEQIVGDHYNVALMLEVGSNPHTAQVTPKNIKDLNSTILYFRIGSHVEWEENLLDKVSFPGKVIDLTRSAKIALLNNEGKSDLHVWTSPHNLELMAGVMCKEICDIDSDNSSEYKSNLNAYKEEVAEVKGLVEEVCEICKSKHQGSWDICVWHPAWQYFCQYANDTYETNFQQVSVETSDGDVTFEDTEKVTKNFKSVFVFTDDTHKDVINDLGITVHAVDPTANDMLDCLKTFISFLKSDLKA